MDAIVIAIIGVIGVTVGALITNYFMHPKIKAETEKSAVLVVAQRIATVINADQIIVLDKGRIVGTGKHQELWKTCPVYREIALSQLSEKELGGRDGLRSEISDLKEKLAKAGLPQEEFFADSFTTEADKARDALAA